MTNATRLRTVRFLLDSGEILLVDLKEHRDSGRLDRDTTLLLVVSGIRETHVTGLVGGDNAGLRDQRVGERRLAVVDYAGYQFISKSLRKGGNVP